MRKVQRISIASAAAVVIASSAYAAIGGRVAHSDLLCQLLLFFCAMFIAVQLIPGLILGWSLFGAFREGRRGRHNSKKE